MTDLKPAAVSSCNPLGIEVGDTIRIRPYISKNMHGDSYDGCLSNIVGVVTGFAKDYSWRLEPNKACIRYLDEDGLSAWETSHILDGLDIVSKGDGEFVIGVTQPYSQRELYEQRLEAFDAKIRGTVIKWEGWSNAATHQAFLALNTDQDIRRRIDSIRRKDGSVNTNKLRDIFIQFKLTVADWTLEPIIDVPKEFEREIHRRGWCQRIDWDAIAGEFKILQAA